MKSTIVTDLLIWFVLSVALVGCVWCAMGPTKRSPLDKERVLLLMENAYFNGQKEAVAGDVRIEQVDGQWKWTKSPWDGEKLPARYNPAKPLKEQLGL